MRAHSNLRHCHPVPDLSLCCGCECMRDACPVGRFTGAELTLTACFGCHSARFPAALSTELTHSRGTSPHASLIMLLWHPELPAWHVYTAGVGLSQGQGANSWQRARQPCAQGQAQSSCCKPPQEGQSSEKDGWTSPGWPLRQLSGGMANQFAGPYGVNVHICKIRNDWLKYKVGIGVNFDF